MNKNKGKKIGVAGNQTTTIDLITGLINKRYSVDCIINMSSNLEGEIAGYVNLGPFGKKHDIKMVRPRTYNLKSEQDKKVIRSLHLDLLLVCGWQRLIPEWLLSELSIGAFGTHGSWKPLPYGRGRSLGNWGILLGKDRVLNNFFKYDKGADSGAIVDTLRFDTSGYDTIATIHHKDQLSYQIMLLKHLPSLINGTVVYQSQSTKQKEVFFPKRSPDDGVIDWNWKTNEIYNLIRAVSKPYPGAFTFYKAKKIMIWMAIPFYLFPVFQKKLPGSIIATFSDSTFVVKTQDGSLLVEQYEAKSWKPMIDQLLKSRENRSFQKLKGAGIL